MYEYFAVLDVIIIVFAIIAFLLSPFIHRALLYAVVFGLIHCAVSVAVGQVESAVIGGLLVLAAIAVPAIAIVAWRSGAEER